MNKLSEEEEEGISRIGSVPRVCSYLLQKVDTTTLCQVFHVKYYFLFLLLFFSNIQIGYNNSHLFMYE